MMNKPVNWNNVKKKMPGLCLDDQQPEGCGIAVSLERTGAGEWVVHCVREKPEGLKIAHERVVSAYDVYQKLDELFRETGYVPLLTEAEQTELELPDRKDIADRRLVQHLPGTWLGSPGGALADGEWTTCYSVEEKSTGKFWLHTGIIAEESDFQAEPQLDQNGPLGLGELLDELRALGFHKNEYSFLLHRPSSVDLKTYLSGCFIRNLDDHASVLGISIESGGEEKWRVFQARRSGEDRMEIGEWPELDARQVHKQVFEVLQTVVPSTLMKKLGLPPLEKLYAESLVNRLKGYWLGTVSGRDEKGNDQERYVSIKKEDEYKWLIQFVKSEEMLTEHKKLHINRIGPFHMIDFVKVVQELDPIIDPFELVQSMERFTMADLSGLTELFRLEME